MSASDHVDPPERAVLSDEDRFLADLVGIYADRRERGVPAHAHDLLARAAEFGDGAVAKLRTVLVLYESLRSDGDSSP